MEKGGLTPKQAAFVREYLVDLNATAAAVRAGYSERTAESQASRLLRNVKVAAAVQEGMNRRAEKATLTAQDVLEGIRRVTEGAESDGDRKNALKGYELLGKHLKLFTDKVEVEHKFTLESLVTGAVGGKASGE